MRRRDFCTASALAVAAIHSKAFAAAQDTPLRVALIGSGWYGKTDLFHLIQVAPVDVVGLCDVDSKMLQEAAELVAGRQSSGKKPPVYGHYRELLAAQKPEIVLVGTPDHWHCLPTIDACKAGADVYVQKPISFDVVEGQAMVAAARKYRRTVQVGLQRRSAPHLLEARDRFIKSGKLGKIAYVDIHSYYGSRKDFPPVQTPPAHLDWDTFVGPASWVDYNPGLHPRRWRDCIDFSNGQTGDLCVHFFDTVRYFLGLGWPKTISASGGSLMRPTDSKIKLHDTQTALFDFGETQIVWTQRNWGTNPDPAYPWGATLYGDKGTLKLSVREFDFTPKGGGESVHGQWTDESDKYPEDHEHKEVEVYAGPATRRHMQNFLAARRENKRPVSDIEEGYISTASCILANLSMRLGRSLAWDAERGKVIGDEEANAKLTSAYRSPYVHPTPENV